MSDIRLIQPFQWFGGKSRISDIIWKAFGNVSNYVEPFAGSLAVLLNNPNKPKIETINDKDLFLINFWRAVSNAPEEVAKFADFPVSEIELHARQKYLLSLDLRNTMETDSEFFDIKAAGYWVYGISASVGDNWLKPKGLNAKPILSSAGCGINGVRYNLNDQFDLLCKRLKRVRMCCGDWSKIVTPPITYKNVGLSSSDITGVFLDPPYNQDGRVKVYINESNIYKDVEKFCLENQDNEKLRIAICGYNEDYNLPNWTKYYWKASGGYGNLSDSTGKENSKKETIWFSKYCLPLIDSI